MTTEEKLDRLTGIVDALAASVVAHDNQIEAHNRQIGALIETAARHERIWQDLQKQWQAYLNTLPRQ
jgi:uncharacterized protein (DUF3084 family)